MNAELTKEFKIFEKDANRILKYQDIQLKKKDAEIARLRASVARQLNTIKDKKTFNRKISMKNQVITKQLSKVKSVEAFLTKKFRWMRSNSDAVRAEMLLRAIIGYEELVRSGKTTFHELVYLSVGYQLDAFSRAEVTKRFGEEITRHFISQIKILVEKGYIRRFDKRLYYFLTPEGEKRFEDLLKIPYGYQYGLYWNRIFTNEE